MLLLLVEKVDTEEAEETEAEGKTNVEGEGICEAGVRETWEVGILSEVVIEEEAWQWWLGDGKGAENEDVWSTWEADSG